MSSRLKRRSSVAFHHANEREAVDRTEVHDDEAERRARNLQRKQAQAQATHIDSPALQGNDKAARRSTAGLSGYTAAQLAEHYNSCIKLSAENKISTKNAFNLNLIDYMATMIKKKESDMSNFQVAAGTLDASTKIYACRVDAVYGDTLKIASGLGNSTKQDEKQGGENGDGMDDGGGDGGVDEDGAKKQRRKKIKKSDAVEKNPKNLNMGKFDLAFDVDPLFKKTASQLDRGLGGNQFLYTLEIKGASQDLLLDPDTEIETAISASSALGRLSAEGETDTDESAGSTTEMENPRLSTVDACQICPSFANFSFTTWSLEDDENDDEYNRLNQSISASQEERQKQSQEDEHAFDAFAEPEPVDDGGGDHFDDGGLGGPDFDDEISEMSERAQGHAALAPGARGFTANLPNTTTNILDALTTAPLEYSYFDQGKLGAWAGPKHWKFKPMSKLHGSIADGEGGGGVKPKKKKEISQIDFADLEEKRGEKELEDKIESMFGQPRKPIKLTEKTMKGWNRDKNTLPEDFHYSGHELVRLKVCDQIVIVGRKSAAETEVDDVEDYDYNNAADKNDYCPDVEDDDYGGDFNDAPEDNIDTSFDGDSQNRFDSQDAGDMSMVDAPKMVDKAALQIGYAKTAKKVDMKRIKNTAWEILTNSSSDDKNVGASPEKQSQNETLHKTKPGKMTEDMNFTEVFHELKTPAKLPSKMTDGLTVPLALLAMLHLCNEQSLELVQDKSLLDFKIKQG